MVHFARARRCVLLHPRSSQPGRSRQDGRRAHRLVGADRPGDNRALLRARERRAAAPSRDRSQGLDQVIAFMGEGGALKAPLARRRALRRPAISAGSWRGRVGRKAGPHPQVVPPQAIGRFTPVFAGYGSMRRILSRGHGVRTRLQSQHAISHFSLASGLVMARRLSMKSSVARLRDRFFKVIIATLSRELGNSTGRTRSDGCRRGRRVQ